MVLVSLCMIMKNEEDELPLVLASAAALADEIVIYDTGSTDRSVVVARELGATVIEGYWDEDFSRARNEALERCSGDWILWLDADEAFHGDAAGVSGQPLDAAEFRLLTSCRSSPSRAAAWPSAPPSMPDGCFVARAVTGAARSMNRSC